jgi:hypothetical protein
MPSSPLSRSTDRSRSSATTITTSQRRSIVSETPFVIQTLVRGLLVLSVVVIEVAQVVAAATLFLTAAVVMVPSVVAVEVVPSLMMSAVPMSPITTTATTLADPNTPLIISSGTPSFDDVDSLPPRGGHFRRRWSRLRSHLHRPHLHLRKRLAKTLSRSKTRN